MAGEKITSVDVARRAGVSASAVSRFYTPGAAVSKKMADKVRKAATELDYRPNVLARSLITGRTRIIGVVVAYLDNQFYPDALERLSNALQQQGYHVLIFMATKTAGNIDDIFDEILGYQVDGIITASVAMSSDLTGRCRQAGVPVVLFNRSQDDAHLSAVTSDNVRGGRKAADHLLACGLRRIGYIAGWEGASTQRDREAGFLARLSEAGLEPCAREVGNFHLDQARDAARLMFAGDDRPEAVFVANDHMAFAVMDVLRSELGLRIPEDVSIVGYDDVPLAAWPAYDLTTVRQPANRMVAETVTILLNAIEAGESEPRRVAIDGELIIRGSVRRLDT
jgi:DNA-binding LacI/PurR family transcriptional regulator